MRPFCPPLNDADDGAASGVNGNCTLARCSALNVASIADAAATMSRVCAIPGADKVNSAVAPAEAGSPVALPRAAHAATIAAAVALTTSAFTTVTYRVI